MYQIDNPKNNYKMLYMPFSIQMVGSILGSMLLWRRIDDYERMLSLAFLLMIGAFILALWANTLPTYAVIFLLFDIALDGFNIAGMNLVIEIASEAKRPVYTALQTNISALGMFFPVLGGVLLKSIGSYTLLYGLTVGLLLCGWVLSLQLKKVK